MKYQKQPSPQNHLEVKSTEQKGPDLGQLGRFMVKSPPLELSLEK